MGRAGSRKPGILAGRVGLDHDFRGSGRVGSENKQRATLCAAVHVALCQTG